MEQEQPRNELPERLTRAAAGHRFAGWSDDHWEAFRTDLREAAEALRAADEVSEAISRFSVLNGMFDPDKSRVIHADRAYRSARGQ